MRNTIRRLKLRLGGYTHNMTTDFLTAIEAHVGASVFVAVVLVLVACLRVEIKGGRKL